MPATITDGVYEIAVQVQCSAAVSSGILGQDSFISAPVRGMIDRTPPAIFGHRLLPASGKYLPGSEISATFNEEIDCTRPYGFRATMTLPGTPTAPIQLLTLADKTLVAYCSGNMIVFEMTATAGVQASAICFVFGHRYHDKIQLRNC